MSNSHIEEMRRLFRDACITQSSTKFLVYIYAVIAESVFSGVEGKYFDSLFVGEDFTKYLPDLNDEHKSILNDLCEYVNDSDGIDFLRGITPDLFAGNLDSLFSFINPYRDRRNFIYDLIMLYGLYEYKCYLNGMDYPERQLRLSKDETLSYIRTNFSSWDKYAVYQKLNDFEENIDKLWLLAFGVPFVPQDIKTIGITKLQKDLCSLGFTNNAALQLFYNCKQAYSFSNLNKLDKSLSYFRKVSYQSIENNFKAEDGKDLPSPSDDLFLSRELFIKSLKKWKETDAVDFIRTLFFSSYSKNIGAENAIVLPYLYRHIADDSVMVVDANPDFILGVVESAYDTSGILFVQHSKDLAMVYQQRFPDCKFAYVQYENNEVQIVLLREDSEYQGRESRYISEIVWQCYDVAIVFARSEREKLLGTLMKGLIERLGTETTVYLFCPNSLLDAKDRSIRLSLSEKYDFRWIQILPTETSSAWLKKTILVCLSRKREGYCPSVKLFNSTLYTSPINKEDIICQELWPVYVPQLEFVESPKTVNRLWEQFRPKPQDGPPRTTRRWNFSKEVVLWYSWSKGRGRVHVYETPTEAQLEKSNMARGKRIISLNKFSADSVETAEKWFGQVIWEEPLISAIIYDIEKNFKHRPMSLKTFWFFKGQELREKAGYREELAKALFESKKLSDLMSDQEYSSEVYQAIIKEDMAELNKKDTVNAWRTLNAIISLANQSGRFLPNTISDFVRSMVEKDRGYQQVRKNLAKRSYELEEENKMLTLLAENQLVRGEYVGAAISFYCGIPNRQICALTWGDYKKLFGGEAGQLWITKTLKDNGEVENLDCDNKNMLRRVPVVKQLIAILDARQKYVKNELCVRDDELNALPIVSKEDFITSCTPENLKSVKNLMEAAADIEPMEVTIAKAGAKVTDLNDYSGDRFRSNFLYRALQTCNMSRAEANYIYGIELPITFAKHYCDYTNDFSQLMLCRKLERWTSLHQEITGNTEIVEKIIPANGCQIQVNSNLYYRSSVELELEVQREKMVDVNGEVIVSIDDNRGVNVTIRKQEI